jgi:PAS domain S-box-containing protein
MDEIELLRRENAGLREELRRTKDWFYRIFHASSNLMAITRIKDGCFLDLNQSSADFGGFDREELIGTSASEHGLWADPEQRDAVLQKIREEGKALDLEVDFLRKDGEIRRVLFSASPIMLNDESRKPNNAE